MSAIARLNFFPVASLPTTRHDPGPSLAIAPSKSAAQSSLLLVPGKGFHRRLGFVVRVAAVDDEWGPEKEDSPAVAVKEDGLEEVVSLKKALVDSFYGTDRGLRASSETRAEIVELITRLEGKNPNPAPTEALSLLNGKWILAYTSFAALFPLLSRGTLPLVKVEEISQTID